jgi:hypothetical protein
MLIHPCSSHDSAIFGVKVEYENQVSTLERELNRWTDYLDIRSFIEDFFTLAKDALSLRRLHRYSRRSVAKFVCVNVTFAGMVILTDIHKKKEFQPLAEW